MRSIIKEIIKFFTTKLIFGKVFDSIRSNFLITSIPLLILVSIFYVPYEYFDYLEFKERFPDDIFGVNFLLVRPVILILFFLFFIILTHRRIKKNDQDRKEKIKREESDKIRRAKEITDKTVSKAGFLETVLSVIGGALGATAGASLGVAGKIAGVMIAVNGALILAPIGAVLGFLGVKAFNNKNKENKK